VSISLLLLLLLLQARWSCLSGPQLSSSVVCLSKLGYSSWPEGMGAALAAALAPQLGRMQGQELLWAAQVGELTMTGL